MKVERKAVESFEYVLTLTPLEAENLHYLLCSRLDKDDSKLYTPMADVLRSACPDHLGRFW